MEDKWKNRALSIIPYKDGLIVSIQKHMTF